MYVWNLERSTVKIGKYLTYLISTRILSYDVYLTQFRSVSLQIDSHKLPMYLAKMSIVVLTKFIPPKILQKVKYLYKLIVYKICKKYERISLGKNKDYYIQIGTTTQQTGKLSSYQEKIGLIYIIEIDLMLCCRCLLALGNNILLEDSLEDNLSNLHSLTCSSPLIFFHVATFITLLL